MGDAYPINLDVRGKTCLVVGGGEVARRKVRALVDAGADVVVVAPDVHPKLKADDRLEIRERAWRDTDLHGAFVVNVATDDAVTNRTVASVIGSPVTASTTVQVTDAGIRIPPFAFAIVTYQSKLSPYWPLRWASLTFTGNHVPAAAWSVTSKVSVTKSPPAPPASAERAVE